MRALAEFAMRGKREAAGVAVVCASLPFLHWLSIAIISLVILRKGVAEGAYVLLWSCLPVLVLLQLTGDSGPAIAFLGSAGLAWLLRATMSWQLILLSIVVVSAIGSLLFEMLSGSAFDQFTELYLAVTDKAVGQDLSSLSTAEADERFANMRSLAVGFFAMGQGVAMFAFLALARWWQSLLYNPGGFQQEMHQLRLVPLAAVGVLSLVMICLALGSLGFVRWVPLLMVPLVITGVCFVHWLVAAKSLSGNWLVSFYVMLVFLAQVLYPMLAFIALADSWLDLRKRIRLDREE
jgi:hypothetical protein